MADDKKEVKTVEVDESILIKIQEDLARIEKDNAEKDARIAGLEQQNANDSEDSTQKMRLRKTFEPKFRTVRIRKFPIAGNLENMGYVVGWTNRGAYQEVDRTGLQPQIVDFIDVIFHGKERDKNGKLQAEKIRLLDLLNSSQVVCKIVDTKKQEDMVATGEELNVLTYDPQHGMISTGEKIDGYVTFSNITYTIEIPAVGKVEIDSTYCN